jgi:subfamily B ATP-binding cassette protein MsbA
MELGQVRGAIAFRDVGFGYGDGGPPVFAGLTLDIRPGEFVALVGSSGVGKSTLCALIPRFYDVTSGAIRVDGHDVQEYELRSLRDQIALVSQDVVLFNDTIRANIAFGRDVSPEAIEGAATAAHVMEFVHDLPVGLDTVVGDRGVLLSGGQRQRISIARALLKNAPILILDEATSALDTESERIIQGALERLMENRTTLVIAHRLSTVEKADRIIVMDGGRIVESGTHGELIARNGQYAALYRMQFSA